MFPRFHTVSGDPVFPKSPSNRLPSSISTATASLRMDMGVVPAWSAWPSMVTA